MTYKDWSAEERAARAAEDFAYIDQYITDNSPFFREMFDFSAYRDRTVLDIGCGSGVFSIRLARAGGQVTSIDLTEEAVEMARLHAEAAEAPLVIVRGDAENLPFASDSFERVFSWGVLHHTSDMQKAFGEAARVLKPGGEGMAMVYHKRSVVYYLHGLFWLLFRGKLFQGHNLESVQDFYTDGYYHRYLTEAEMKAVLDGAGLRHTKTVVTQYQKKILPLIPDAIDRFLKARFGMCLVVWFEVQQK